MTATLVPPQSAVARFDPNARLSDYLDALRFYLALPASTVDRILFVDNSGSDIAPIVRCAQDTAHDKAVQVISFTGNDHAPSRGGKAWGEFKLLDHGLANCELFAPDDVVWKTTGRLKFLNLTRMVGALSRTAFDLVCDLHNVPWVGAGDWRNNFYMDLRVFAFRVSAYDAIFRNCWRERERHFNAKFLYRKAMDARGRFRVLPRFPIQPRLQGISGRHLRDYNGTPQRMKDNVRAFVRQVAPWVWL